MAQVTNLLACLVKQLCRERTGADACAVCFHDTEDIANLVGTDTKTGAGSSTNGIRRSHKRIASEVDIEHRTLSTFAEHTLAALQDIIDFMLTVNNGELAQVLYALQPFLFYFGNIVFKVERFQDSLMAGLCSSILLGKVLQDITHAQAVARYFVGVCRTDAFTGGAYLVLTLLSLIGCVQHAVCRHNEVRLL